jgi:hypothetical protein
MDEGQTVFSVTLYLFYKLPLGGPIGGAVGGVVILLVVIAVVVFIARKRY